MAYEKEPVILNWELDSKESLFEAVLDKTCERLKEKHIQYSIRRIREMDEELDRLEKELDEFIGNESSRGQRGARGVVGNAGGIINGII